MHDAVIGANYIEKEMIFQGDVIISCYRSFAKFLDEKKTAQSSSKYGSQVCS